MKIEMMFVGIALLGMLVVGCGGTVVVTATPTATVQPTATPVPTVTPVPTPTSTPVPTVTPAPTPTPDLRAALREECNLAIASALQFLVLVEEQYGDAYLAGEFDEAGGIWVTGEEILEMNREVGRIGSAVHESGLAYFYRWMAGMDVNASNEEAFARMFNMIIEDLVDGEC